MLARALKFSAGLAAGIALLYLLAPSWISAMARMAEPLVRIDPRLRHSIVWVEGSDVFVRSTTGTPPPITFPATQLIFNIPLLIALFASNRRPLQRAYLRAFAIATAIVLLTHPLSLVVGVESTYAARMGEWSERNYGTIATNVWLYLEMFWRLIGMFALPFGLWWLACAQVETQDTITREKKGKRSR